MSISRISLSGIRNLMPASLDLSPRVNIFYGDNGSGKTSFLEAVHFLALARSFRSSKYLPMIQHNQDEALVFAQINSASDVERKIGVRRTRQADIEIKIDGQSVRTISALARHLPLQLITPESFLLLEGSPKLRRQFMDWGVFHVEHQFIHYWQRMQASLKQRNSWLRHAILDSQQLAAWDKEYCSASTQIDQFRQAYIKRLEPVFFRTLEQLVRLPGLTLNYYRGWDKERALQDVLVANQEKERGMGYTQSGPHRADLRIRINQSDAVDILSRGQQKLVVCALKLAQGILLSQEQQIECIYLVDDLYSELDQGHRKALCVLLEDMNSQIFVSGTDKQLLVNTWEKETPVALFHVEQGRIIPLGANE